ncbi:hypothetical protein C5C03_00225 [Clavibacter michiganensis]|uniref:hypothetical protein n=1 Tax=Clavibacter michiganensis TaxID=28447 RepID=UPI000CE7F000|nr:hypothetical protein [Clavibacter michiganensis]PPF91287.1 hypothetical protein C5C03_00225 [Clavibacter michiganensis]PPF99329.1 hypothetical protein C5C05_02030 [Clavibacter michiganensis]
MRRFDPDAFVRSRDTAVLISRNGAGSGGAFVAALVRSIARAGERAAAADDGRIRVPVVLDLDETANIVRWPELARIVFDKERGPFRTCTTDGHLADKKGEPLTITPGTPPDDVELL